VRPQLIALAGAASLAASSLTMAPAHAGNGSICTGTTRPNLCVNQKSGFGGLVRQYGVSTGGPAQSGLEAYRAEVLCGSGTLTLRLIETPRGLGLGLGAQSIETPLPATFCPDLLPFLP